MTILQLISTAGFYGAESVVLGLCESFQRLGHRAVLACFCNEQNPNRDLAIRAAAAGVEVEVIPCRGQIDLSAFRRLRAYLRSIRPDVLHLHGYKADVYGWAARSGRECGLVATAHNWTNASNSLRLYARIDRAVLSRFDKVCCVSDRVREALLSAGVSEDTLVTIINGVDLNTFRGSDAPLRKQAPPGATIVGMVGRMVHAKGFHSVLQAAPRILERHPDAYFAFVGDGPDTAMLRQLAARLHIESRVLFAGARADMPAVYQSFDMLALPSLNEGMPMVVLEAMAAGLPVIATRVGAIPGIIEDGRTGLLIDPGHVDQLESALAALLRARDLRVSMGLAARDWVAAHASVERTAELYLNNYAAVLNRRVATMIPA